MEDLNQGNIIKLRKMLEEYDTRYVVVRTLFTRHYIERLMPTCSDRGRYKWIAETAPDAFDNAVKTDDNKQEFYHSNIDGSDMFPRLYFDLSCCMVEFQLWLRARNLVITHMEAK